MNQVETQRDIPYYYKLRCRTGYEINVTFQSVKGLRRADRYILWL